MNPSAGRTLSISDSLCSLRSPFLWSLLLSLHQTPKSPEVLSPILFPAHSTLSAGVNVCLSVMSVIRTVPEATRPGIAFLWAPGLHHGHADSHACVSSIISQTHYTPRWIFLSTLYWLLTHIYLIPCYRNILFHLGLSHLISCTAEDIILSCFLLLSISASFLCHLLRWGSYPLFCTTAKSSSAYLLIQLRGPCHLSCPISKPLQGKAALHAEPVRFSLLPGCLRSHSLPPHSGYRGHLTLFLARLPVPAFPACTGLIALPGRESLRPYLPVFIHGVVLVWISRASGFCHRSCPGNNFIDDSNIYLTI